MSRRVASARALESRSARSSSGRRKRPPPPDASARTEHVRDCALGSALHERRDLRVCGAPVSASLLCNLEGFQKVWHAWYGCGIVDIIAEEETYDATGSGPAVVAFSGGLDS